MPEQYYGPFNLFEGTGFRVLVHDQNDWPDVENYGIDISPGFHSTIRMQRFKVIWKIFLSHFCSRLLQCTYQ